MRQKYDVVIIGGGIIGATIAYYLASYCLKTILLEKNILFADETSRGNSGVIHCGFDANPQKMTGKLNALGNKIWTSEIFKKIEFPRAQVDSLVIGLNQKEMQHVDVLYQRGLENNVPCKNLKILTKEELLIKEPNINPKAKGALLCDGSWMINVPQATLALLEDAKKHQVEVCNKSKVTKIKTFDDHFVITINGQKQIIAKNIVNAAGHQADLLANQVSPNDFKLQARRGQYRILSKKLEFKVNSICFLVPRLFGKGVIIAPMLDGRTLIGPTAEDNIAKDDVNLITQEQYQFIGQAAQNLMPKIELERTEISFAGSRPIDSETNDFVIRYAKNNNHFINVAGIKSPGISSAPAIALEIIKLLQKNGTKLVKR